MKPVSLTIEGLRSYRDRTTIDFSDVRLFAIVGDTGAGKSSILEAITYALFAGSTWSKQGGDLISDGAYTMTVEFTFEVDGERWTVNRSMSQGVHRPPRHLLVSAEDPAKRFDGKAAVDAQIERLLGLTWETFLQAVVLPQGDFQALLEAEASKRTALLKGIFRLDVLDEIKELARAAGDRLRPKRDELVAQRAALLPDPDAARTDAAVRLSSAMVRLESLRAASELVREHERGAAQARGTAATGTTDALRVRSQAEKIQVDQLKALDGLAESLRGGLAGLDEHDRQAQVRESDLLAEVIQLKKDGQDLASIAASRSWVDSLRQSRRAVQERHRAWLDEDARLVSEGAGIEAENDAIARDDASLPDLRSAAQKAVEEREHADKQVADAVAAVEAWSRARMSAAEAEGEHAKRQVDLADATGLNESATKTMASARRDREAAEAEYSHAQGVHAARVALGNAGPGDPCPVCARPLPRTFVAPMADELDAARAADEQASDAYMEATNAAAAALQAVEAASRELDGARARAAEAASRFDAAAGALTAILPTTPSSDDDVGELVEHLKAVAAGAKESERLVGEALRQKSAEVGARRQALAARQDARDHAFRVHETNAAQIRSAEDAADALATKLPESLRPSPHEEEYERVLGQLEVLESAARGLEEKQGAVATERERIRDERRALEQRLSTEIDGPRARARADIAALIAVLSGAGAGADDLSDEPTATNAEIVRTAAVNAVAALEKAVEEAKLTCERHEQAMGAALAAVGVEDVDLLMQELEAAAADRGVAEKDLRRAEHDAPLAQALDQRISVGTELVDRLADLARLLADGKFVGRVVEVRQLALLGAASSILGSMSNDRFGFSQGFEIVDRFTGLPRSPKTLSGGEKFQASLALALALVEIASRSGGRLDAVFLDEGFGSLDANALDEALEELMRRAEAGRVIGVISHLRAVAERFERVLRVDNELGRTSVRWVAGVDAGDESASDLADHLTGTTA
jgi:exonuclease SbcC